MGKCTHSQQKTAQGCFQSSCAHSTGWSPLCSFYEVHTEKGSAEELAAFYESESLWTEVYNNKLCGAIWGCAIAENFSRFLP